MAKSILPITHMGQWYTVQFHWRNQMRSESNSHTIYEEGTYVGSFWKYILLLNLISQSDHDSNFVVRVA